MLLYTGTLSSLERETPRSLLARTVAAHGGKEAFYRLRDVQYQLTVRNPTDGKEDTSLERYLFDGERSYGRYQKRDFLAEKGPAGLLEQFFDGRKVGVRVNSSVTHDASALHFASLSRKGNYFWFALPFKLLDQGLIAEPAGTTTLDGVRLERIDVRFAPGVGEQSDRIRLFLDATSKEINRLVFSGRALGGGPYLMTFSYESLHGLRLATRRSYRKGDWDGTPKGPILAEHILEDIRFWNGYGSFEFIP